MSINSMRKSMRSGTAPAMETAHDSAEKRRSGVSAQGRAILCPPGHHVGDRRGRLCLGYGTVRIGKDDASEHTRDARFRVVRRVPIRSRRGPQAPKKTEARAAEEEHRVRLLQLEPPFSWELVD